VNHAWPWVAAIATGSAVLALIWWAWQQVGLAALQLGMGAC
jgi:hypothetical protein